ncbi:MAG: glycoside hydrolase family 3, partial [Ectothiorhodospiraceae bacterium]|nr:glycoside hydrolase family 3 [Ectothiorhodospiraceae bacterium]
GLKERNIESPEQVRNLTTQLQEHAEIPLFIGIDQEGGWVNRLKERRGFIPTMSQQKLGAKNDTAFTYRYAQKTAQQLRSIGINLNFAPVVDVNSNPENPVIGKLERSFSANPYSVTKHALATIKAHRSKGVLCAIKHFPGHGSAWHDSHEGLANVSTTWSMTELIPFRQIIRADECDIVMTAHIFNGKLDGEYPATLSEKIIGGILRDSLGYDGVVISDDLQMRAITNFYGLEQAILKAVQAGVDILLFSNNSIYDDEISEKAIRILRHYVRTGKISEDRIDASFRRIMTLKREIGWKPTN